MSPASRQPSRAHEIKNDAKSWHTAFCRCPFRAPEEAEMADEDLKSPRPGSDSEEMVGSEGVGSAMEFDTGEFDDEDLDAEESGNEESETE